MQPKSTSEHYYFQWCNIIGQLRGIVGVGVLQPPPPSRSEIFPELTKKVISAIFKAATLPLLLGENKSREAATNRPSPLIFFKIRVSLQL